MGSHGDRLELLNEFKELADPSDFHHIPELPEKRKATDKPFIYLFGITLLFLFGFLTYSLIYSDLGRFTHGYDQCGNVCGKKNPHFTGLSCSGRNMEGKPYLFYDESIVSDTELLQRRHCAASCDIKNYSIIMNRCIPLTEESKYRTAEAYVQEVCQSIQEASLHIVAMVTIALGLCIATVLLFRHATKFMVWGILIVSIIGLCVLTGLLWYWTQLATDNLQKMVFLATFFTVLTCLLIVVFICMFKRIKLIILLFREAMSAVFDMPLLLFEPLLTFIAMSISIAMMMFTNILLSESGTLQLYSTTFDNKNAFFAYIPNTAMLFTIIFNGIVTVWMMQFIVGCQHMIISGAVSTWYFTRDKTALVSPIYNSFRNLILYHLGTVCIGSLIITIVQLVRAAIKILSNTRHLKVLLLCCLSYLEAFLRYLTKNAYIQTAMHGQGFFKSGRRGAKLLLTNYVNVLALNSVGDFVLTAASMMIIVITILSGCLMYDYNIKHFYAAIALAAFVASIMAYCIFTVYEMAIDTLFMCYCEDSCMNDGTSHPYFMTKNLMLFVEESKKVVPKKN